MTTTRYFKSTDSGAPVLTGQTGSLLALLHACLVGTAGVAYGSGPTAKTAAGWTEPFTNTSVKGVFRNSLAAGGTGMYCRVLDDGSLASTFKEAWMVAYASMSDLDTGTGQTPLAATLATGINIRKSTTADGTARAWRLVADEITWYLEVQSNPANSAESCLYSAGDISSEIAGDNKRYYIFGKTTVNSGVGPSWINGSASFGATSNSGFYLATGYAQTGNPVTPSLTYIGGSGNAVGGPGAPMVNPAPGSSNQYYSPPFLGGESTYRGRFRGVYYPLNNLSAVTFATEIPNASGLPSGSNLLLCPIGNAGGQVGVLAVETALAW